MNPKISFVALAGVISIECALSEQRTQATSVGQPHFEVQVETLQVVKSSTSGSVSGNRLIRKFVQDRLVWSDSAGIWVVTHFEF